ncbi:hypothetical protein BFAG_01037 [Bacteroides fragilis 3_1_12]|uniref:Uncharacterized protein n=1 Tax=Bacteroides fragilis 3_1_12 TaxID=457424 RepID=A0ABN0BHF1_BACFG|nr:hypothetical protein BFAG_01037 [Bacteroides fragilis 3_1_12]
MIFFRRLFSLVFHDIENLKLEISSNMWVRRHCCIPMIIVSSYCMDKIKV